MPTYTAKRSTLKMHGFSRSDILPGSWSQALMLQLKDAYDSGNDKPIHFVQL